MNVSINAYSTDCNIYGDILIHVSSVSVANSCYRKSGISKADNGIKINVAIEGRIAKAPLPEPGAPGNPGLEVVNGSSPLAALVAPPPEVGKGPPPIEMEPAGGPAVADGSTDVENKVGAGRERWGAEELCGEDGEPCKFDAKLANPIEAGENLNTE